MRNKRPCRPRSINHSNGTDHHIVKVELEYRNAVRNVRELFRTPRTAGLRFLLKSTPDGLSQTDGMVLDFLGTPYPERTD